MDFIERRKAVTKYIVDVLTLMEPDKAANAKRWEDFLERMTDAEFGKFMDLVKEGKAQLYMYVPNMESNLDIDNLMKAADFVGVNMFERVVLTDTVSGRMYLTNHEYMILQIPIRKVAQFLVHKRSFAESDKRVETLTGQVTGDDRAARITQVEMQLLSSRGLMETVKELAKVRGGDVYAYGDMIRQIQENGEAHMSLMPGNTTVRSAKILNVFLRGMHLDNTYGHGEISHDAR